MRVDEPPNKKQKLQNELTDGLSSESGDVGQTRDCPADSTRVPAAHDTNLACASATATGNSEYGQTFVVSPTGRLFVTDVQSSQTVAEIVASLGIELEPCALNEQDVAIYFRGSELQGSMTAAEAGLTKGHTLAVCSRQAAGSGTELLPRLLPLWLNLIRAAKKGNLQEAPSTLEQASTAVHFLQKQLLGADKGDEATDRLYTKSCQGVVRSLLEANSIPVLLSVVQLSEDKSTSWLADVHHTASKCLFGIEGYLSSAPYNINNEDQGFGAQPDTDRVQAVLVLQLELAVWSIEHAHETEQDRQTGEQLRQTGEQARQTGEHLRQIGEQARQNGEQPRQNAEQPRQNGEQARQTGEQNGQTGEQPRQIGEQTRQASVQFRQTGEQPRQVGEEPRQTGEQPRQTGEQTRQNGEEPRQTGEQPRQTGEEPRQTGEEPRQTGEDRAAPDESESALHPLQQLAGHLAAARHHWSQDMFSEECFDASVRQHALRQLAVCIVEASKAISSGLIDLELSITSLATESHHVPKLLSNLRLTAAFSTMVQSYVQWRGPGVSTETQRIWQSLQGLVGALVRCASACSSFAWACIQLGVSPATESVDRYSGQVTVDSFEQRFAKGIPAAFKDHIGALLPGLHALAYSSLLAGSAGRDQAQALFQKIVTMQPLEACLKAIDLRPGGSLFPGAFNEVDEFAQHLPQELRRQYLLDLFPDPSSQLTNEGGGADWTQAIVSRDDLIAQSADWDLVLDKKLYVQFENEPGVGSGVMKEWLLTYARWLFRESGLWQSCPYDPATVYIARHPNHGAYPISYRCCGQVAGLAMKYRCPLGVKLSRCFLRELSERSLDDAAYNQIDSQVHRSIRAIMEASHEELEQMHLTNESPFGTPFRNQPDGTFGEAVGRHNVTQYAQSMRMHYFSRRNEAKEFLAGLLSMSEWESWASQHDPNDWPDASHMLRPILAEDFGSMLCGQLTPLCVNEWRTATAAQGFLYKDACKDVDWFWEMVMQMTDKQQRKLLHFWTSLHTLPAGGFPDLPQQLQLHTSHQKLPTSHTCAFQLNLPHFLSLEDMTAAFETALTESEGFGFA